MNDDKKNLQMLNQVISEGDQWLREYGVVSDLSHNTIVSNIYLMFPQVKYVDYLIDQKNQIMDMYVYVSFWRLLWMTLFGRRDKLLNEIFYLTSGYLKDYELRVNLRRFKGEEAANKYLESLIEPKKEEKTEE